MRLFFCNLSSPLEIHKTHLTNTQISPLLTQTIHPIFYSISICHIWQQRTDTIPPPFPKYPISPRGSLFLSMQKYFKLMPVTSENNTNQIICSVTQEGRHDLRKVRKWQWERMIEWFIHSWYLVQSAMNVYCHTRVNTNSKHWFTTSFLQPLPYLVTP